MHYLDDDIVDLRRDNGSSWQYYWGDPLERVPASDTAKALRVRMIGSAFRPLDRTANCASTVKPHPEPDRGPGGLSHDQRDPAKPGAIDVDRVERAVLCGKIDTLLLQMPHHQRFHCDRGRGDRPSLPGHKRPYVELE